MRFEYCQICEMSCILCLCFDIWQLHDGVVLRCFRCSCFPHTQPFDSSKCIVYKWKKIQYNSIHMLYTHNDIDSEVRIERVLHQHHYMLYDAESQVCSFVLHTNVSERAHNQTAQYCNFSRFSFILRRSICRMSFQQWWIYSETKRIVKQFTVQVLSVIRFILWRYAYSENQK